MKKVDLNDAVWVMMESHLSFTAYKILLEELTSRKIRVFLYKPEKYADLENLLLKSDKHFIFQNPLCEKLKNLSGILEKRRNFSILYSDWWAIPLTDFTKYSDYIIFNHFNGIRAIKEGGLNKLSGPVPLFSLPEKKDFHEILLSFLRIPFLLIIPFIDATRRTKRKLFDCNKKKLLYFPFAIDAKNQEFQNEENEKKYDFANVGATSFFCRSKNYYVPAKLSYVNLYRDRQKIINEASKNNEFRVFDCRKNKVYGQETLKVIKNSKYAISTGGYHQASILKYLEIIACGTPVIGYKIPREFPMLNDAIYEVDVLNLSDKEIHEKLKDALLKYDRYKKNAEQAKKKILEFYNQESLLDLLQRQYDGLNIPEEYVN